MNWNSSTLGNSLSLIRNGLSCKQNKSCKGERISRIETIANAEINPDKIGYAPLTDSQKEKYKLKQGDILFSHINSAIHVGKTAYVDKDHDLYHGMNLLLLRPSEGVASRFLEYYLKQLFWSGYWQVRCKRSVNQASVNQKDIKKVPFAYPPILEQKRIVAILDEAFAGIDQAIANTEKNLANAREVFESYLNEVFTQKGTDWIATSLVNEIELLTGFAFKSKDYSEEPDGIRLLRGDNIVQGAFRWESAKKWSANDVDSYTKYYLRAGDVVLAMDRTWVKAGLKYAQIGEKDLPCLLVQRVARLRPKSDLDSNFLKYLISSKEFTKYVLSIQTGSGVPHISGAQIKAFQFGKPTTAIQKKISAELDKLHLETQHLESIYQKKLNALAELKQSILHKAFTGELTHSPEQEFAEVC
ncbi:MAG: hypothetical protein D3909_04790 [Candidatus Electrothrix sp. ATG1]|nr:hypothetical protein [Candidatus Electrothrix sp. ATG1]